jgi:hypothetical protein
VRTSRSLLIALLIALPALGIYGQQTGEVTGTVTDATGAAVAGSTVTATNTATRQVRTAASNDTGMYTLPYLQPDVYDIRAEKAATLLHLVWSPARGRCDSFSLR